MDDQIATPSAARRTRTKRAGVVVAAGLVGGLAFAGTSAFGPSSASAAPAPVATAAAAAVSAAPATTVTASVDPDDAALAAFFKAGYTYDDAVALAKIWNVADVFQVKATAGHDLLSGEKLPVAPGSAAPAPQSSDDDPVAAYFNAGYNYNDAVALAKLWHLATPYDAKVAGSQRLTAGQTLPIQP